MAVAPRFSVVIPTHNRPGLLDEAIASVLAQTDPDLECIVVDDAGNATVPTTDPRVRVIHHAANEGPAAARNTGVAAARGTFVAFLDDDDVYVPDRLERALPVLDRAQLALCWGVWMGTRTPHGRLLEGLVHDVILDEITPHISTVTLRRDDFEPFDVSYAATEDVEWWLRVTRARTVSTDAHVGVLLRRHDSPRHRNPRSARIEASKRLIAQYPEYFATHPRAHALRWKRIGILALQDGRRGDAAAALLRSLRILPSLRGFVHLARAVRLSPLTRRSRIRERRVPPRDP